MEPANFDEANTVLTPPRGFSEAQVGSLNVWKGALESAAGMNPSVISCWKPSRAELEEIARTGRVWLYVMAETMPPVCVSGESPFR